MNKSFNKGKKIITWLYIIGLLGMISILVVIGVTKQEKNHIEKESTYQNISSSWTLDKAGTQPVDVKKLGEYMDEKLGVLSISLIREVQI